MPSSQEQPFLHIDDMDYEILGMGKVGGIDRRDAEIDGRLGFEGMDSAPMTGSSRS